MGNIYKNSELDLSAIRGADGAEGLLAETRKYITSPIITTPDGKDYHVNHCEGDEEISPI